MKNLEKDEVNIEIRQQKRKIQEDEKGQQEKMSSSQCTSGYYRLSMEPILFYPAPINNRIKS